MNITDIILYIIILCFIVVMGILLYSLLNDYIGSEDDDDDIDLWPK